MTNGKGSSLNMDIITVEKIYTSKLIAQLHKYITLIFIHISLFA